jgi:transposase
MQKVVRSPGESQVKSQSRSASKSEPRAKQRNAKPVLRLVPTKLPQTLPADIRTELTPVEPDRRPIARFVGLDVGKKTEFCEMREGRVVARAQLVNDDDLKQRLGPGSPRARVVLESCRESWHLHDLLTDWGHQVWVVDTTRVQQLGIGHHRRKNDRIDAEKLAKAGESGQVPKAWILTHASQKQRHLLLLRRVLVDTRAQYVVAIRSLLRALGCPAPGCATSDFARKLDRMQLSEDVRSMIAPLVVIIETLQPQIEQADKQLDEYCKPSPVIALLSTVGGVGRIVSAVFMSVIDQPLRFQNAHQVQAYLGLVPSEKTSGRRRLGAITKHGNSYARAMLVEAAWSILTQRRSDPLKSWGKALARRKGNKVAAVALARRLAGILWAMWRDGTVYDPQCVGQPSARGKRNEASQTLQTAAQIEAAAAGA